MKPLLTITFLLLTSIFFGQTVINPDAVYDLTISYRPATVQLLTDTNAFPAFNVNNIESMTYKNIQPGHYKILISGRGQTSVIKENITVGQGQHLVLRFKINGPCLYHHPASFIPRCPENHNDSIIAIQYGLVATKGNPFIKDRKELKIKYGGCVTTDCDPQFYCRKHDIEF